MIRSMRNLRATWRALKLLPVPLLPTSANVLGFRTSHGKSRRSGVRALMGARSILVQRIYPAGSK
jgi:hypothetical protein